MKIKIYTGLSVTPRMVHTILEKAVVARPIKRGDLLEDIAAGFHVIGIVDGEFLQSLSVSPGEIMDAIRCGLKVYGSSSLGALRAVELEHFGMLGCGRIYELIRNMPYFKDDYLGQLFYGETIGHVTVPFMDLLLGLEELAGKNIVSSQEAHYLAGHYERLHFSERSFAGLRAAVQGGSMRNRDKMLRVVAVVENNMIKTKGRDALELLRKIKRDVSRISSLNARLQGELT